MHEGQEFVGCEAPSIDPNTIGDVAPNIAKIEEARDILRAYLRGNQAASIERAHGLLESAL